MERMCRAKGIVFEATHDQERLQIADYDILWLPMEWIDPTHLPPSIRILYGPQHFVFPDQANSGVCGPEDETLSKRSFYICLSPWVKDLYEEFSPWFKIPLVPIPFGIQQLPPRDLNTCTLDCIVYFKRRNPMELNKVLSILEFMKVKYQCFSYGSYQEHAYQQALQTTKCIVWLGTHESQGFALQEALSRNIPICILDAKTMYDEYKGYDSYRGTKDLKSTTASWWDSRCGEKISNIDSLHETLTNMLTSISSYKPAEYVKEVLSDDVCMSRILKQLSIQEGTDNLHVQQPI